MAGDGPHGISSARVTGTAAALRVGFLDVPVVADGSLGERFRAAFDPWLNLDTPPLLGTSDVSLGLSRADVGPVEVNGTTLRLHADRVGVERGAEITADDPPARYVSSAGRVQLHYPAVGELELLDAL